MANSKTYHSPSEIGAPLANYSHSVECAPGQRWLFASGQLGNDEHGEIPDDAEAQAHLCFEKIKSLLEAAEMSMSDLVRINAFVSDRDHMAGYMRARDAHVSTPPPASTLVIVSGFTQPEFKVEIEIVAAAPPRK